jgi:small subunit ribosomal protein S4
MGDPRTPKKQFKKPGHPWEAERIKEEAQLKTEYGLSNKKEIWKINSKLRNWRTQARQIVSLPEEQRNEQEKALVSKLNRLGVLADETKIDDILALNVRAVLDRRLQSQVYKLGLSNSAKQARQFILHSKVIVDGKVITAPSYLVKKSNKVKIIETFAPKLKAVYTVEPKVEVKVKDVSKDTTDEQVVEKLASAATKEANHGKE